MEIKKDMQLLSNSLRDPKNKLTQLCKQMVEYSQGGEDRVHPLGKYYEEALKRATVGDVSLVSL